MKRAKKTLIALVFAIILLLASYYDNQCLKEDIEATESCILEDNQTTY